MLCLKLNDCQVGASNELPESEELDALYDRFLVRRQVSQVSSAQLSALARLAAGTLQRQDIAEDAPPSNGSPAQPLAAASPLTLEEFKCGCFPTVFLAVLSSHSLCFGMRYQRLA